MTEPIIPLCSSAVSHHTQCVGEPVSPFAFAAVSAGYLAVGLTSRGQCFSNPTPASVLRETLSLVSLYVLYTEHSEVYSFHFIWDFFSFGFWEHTFL